MFFLFAIDVSRAADNVIANERELREECSYDLVGMRECLIEKQIASEVNLTLANKKVYKTLTQWDEDQNYIKAAKVKLAAAEKAFIVYRNAQCQFAASLGGGAIGNALDTMRFACVADLNNKRAEQLRNAIFALPLK